MHLPCAAYASQVINAENYALRALRDLGYTHTRNGCEAVALTPAPAQSSASPSALPLPSAVPLHPPRHTSTLTRNPALGESIRPSLRAQDVAIQLCHPT